MPIELAPNNKRGLALDLPLLAGSGAVGLGDDWPPGVEPEHFGAIVTTGITWGPQRGPGQPRLAEIPGGFMLATGDQNPGLRRVLEQQAPDWPGLGVPVIVALAAADPGDWARLAEALDERPGVAGLELQLADDVGSGEARTSVGAARRASTLPLLVKLPSTRAAEIARACITGGADALVVGTAPRGACLLGEGAWIEAPVAGPAALPFTLLALRRVMALDLPPVPLIAAGGIQTLGEAAQCLELGAMAVQVRSLAWTDPAGVIRLAEGLRNLEALAP